ncbi:hypothetical protein FKW77_003228 [Venturia effusa]|uniref:Uncharacterized protein n=1 Tax=Venturia effusa TaxID=50376 RepID=A0A517LCA0_9PEZI|nr:hypothetical protein FKW77_003228 [Venturia effusa]
MTRAHWGNALWTPGRIPELPPGPEVTMHWTTEKIIYLTYFLTVPVAAILFLIWVHIRWPEKRVRTKTEVLSRAIEVNEGVKGGKFDMSLVGTGAMVRMDSVEAAWNVSKEAELAGTREMESGRLNRQVGVVGSEGGDRKEGARSGDDLEIQVV